MLIHHLFYNRPEFGPRIVSLGIACKICVTLFVFISGYGMATSFPQKVNGLKKLAKTFLLFLCKRHIKFFFNYWCIFFIAIPIGTIFFGRTLSVAYGSDSHLVESFVKDIFCQQGFHSYNITWWINDVFLSLWLCFPIFYYLTKQRIFSIGVLLFLFFQPWWNPTFS